MTESKRRSTKTRAADAGAQGFTLPSADKLAAAREKATTRRHVEQQAQAGQVIGIDPAEYATAILDLRLPRLKQEYYRERWSLKGYVKIEGEPLVVGYDRAEVWVKRREDADADAARRRQSIEDMVASGRMHRSALGGRQFTQQELPQRRTEII